MILAPGTRIEVTNPGAPIVSTQPPVDQVHIVVPVGPRGPAGVDGGLQPWHKTTSAGTPPAHLPFVNATDFGVAADGATDDTEALQAAIDWLYSVGGGTLILPAGTILVSAQIDVWEHIWIVGAAPGGWENYAAVNIGTTIKLKATSGLTASDAVVRFAYQGTYTSERRHQGGMVGVTVDGNRTTNTANSGVLLSGVRFIHLERVHAVRCGLHGFSAVTDTTATSEMSFVATFAGFNGSSGYRLYGGDSTILGAMAGVNDGDGFYLGLAATACTGLSSWNNKRDGLAIASTTATQALSIVGGQFYDNDRAGITVEAPGGNSMLGNSIVGASCHGNGRQDFVSYPSATDRVGIRVLGVHTPIMLSIHSCSLGNRDYTLPTKFQQYGIALQTASCNPTVSGISGDNNVALWYLVDATAIPENQAGRFVPLKDNVFSIGRSSLRWANFLGLRHTVFKNLNDAQPSAQLGSTAGAAELSLGPGGSTAPDWKMSRVSADRVDLTAGDMLGLPATYDAPLWMGANALWTGSDGLLRIKAGTPSSDTDGALVDPTLGLSSGEGSIPRMNVTTSSVATTSGTMRLTYFTARKSETVGNVRVDSGATAAGATPTLCRVGVYEEDPTTGDLTLVGSTANDTALFAAASTQYTKALSATFAKVAGRRYAIGVLVVTGATAPTFLGSLSSTALNLELAAAPRLGALVTGQTDLPSSVVAGSLATPTGLQFAVVKP